MAQAFSDRDGLIWMNGEIIPWRDAKVHVLTHGLHYASSVFEGERAYDGNIFLCQEHSERLIRSAELIDMDMPMTAEEINQAKKEILAASLSLIFKPRWFSGSKFEHFFHSAVSSLFFSDSCVWVFVPDVFSSTSFSF